MTDSTKNEIERAALNWKGGVRSDLRGTSCMGKYILHNF